MGSRRRNFGIRPVIDSNKNVVSIFAASAVASVNITDIADTQDSATLAVADDVERGCSIRAIWLELWYRATATSVDGVTTGFDMYLFKNPGNNLTPPLAGTLGTSNEKKFAFKTWKGLTGTVSQGNGPYNWQGWIKIPKRYQRMGANDKWQLVHTATGQPGLLCMNAIYKWYK